MNRLFSALVIIACLFMLFMNPLIESYGFKSYSLIMGLLIISIICISFKIGYKYIKSSHLKEYGWIMLILGVIGVLQLIL